MPAEENRRGRMANPDLVKQFGGKLVGIYTGAVLTKLIEVGYQLGLFEASRAGPATGGIYGYDPATRQYALPEEHAMLLTGNGAQNASPMSRMLNHFGTHLPKL